MKEAADGLAANENPTTYSAKSLGGGTDRHKPKELYDQFKKLERDFQRQIEAGKKKDLTDGANGSFDAGSATAGQKLSYATGVQVRFEGGFPMCRMHGKSASEGTTSMTSFFVTF